MSDKLRNNAFLAEIIQARDMGNEYPPDYRGRFPWDRSERRGKATTLSKASIGEFCFAVLSCGGSVTSIWPFAPQYIRSSVFYRVHLSITQKKKLEAETPYRFDPPPVAKLNSEFFE